MLTPDLVNQFRNQTIVVAGDTYVDREFYGDVFRLAPEAPVPVLKVKSKRLIPGGATNVAKNIALLGAKVVLCSGLGDHRSSRELLAELPNNVEFLALSPNSLSPPPERYRLFAANQQLLQIVNRPASQSEMAVGLHFAELLRTKAFERQVLVIYDQGYGFVTQELLQAASEIERSGVRVIIDANPAHAEWYGKAALLTFNSGESLEAAERLGRPCQTVDEAGRFLCERLDSEVLVTQGGEGMVLFQRRSSPETIPAVLVQLADRAGAGDVSTAVLALCLASGAPLRKAAELANKAASVVVAKPGIGYVSPEELMNLFQQDISQLMMESVEVKRRLIDQQLPAIENVVKSIINAYRSGRTVYAFGNGGSAADANHFITELVGRFRIERRALPALSFSANEILMTSIANDYGYENTFARQVEAFVKDGDLVVAFSTSGKSPNVVVALGLAKQKGATTVGFTGNSAGEFPGLCDICIRVPSDNTPRIQEAHVAVVHIICELMDKELAHAV